MEIIVGIALLLLIIIIALIAGRYLCKNSAYKIALIAKIKKQVFWNAIIRALILSYLKFCINSLQ